MATVSDQSVYFYHVTSHFKLMRLKIGLSGVFLTVDEHAEHAYVTMLLYCAMMMKTVPVVCLGWDGAVRNWTWIFGTRIKLINHRAVAAHTSGYILDRRTAEELEVQHFSLQCSHICNKHACYWPLRFFIGYQQPPSHTTGYRQSPSPQRQIFPRLAISEKTQLHSSTVYHITW